MVLGLFNGIVGGLKGLRHSHPVVEECIEGDLRRRLRVCLWPADVQDEGLAVLQVSHLWDHHGSFTEDQKPLVKVLLLTLNWKETGPISLKHSSPS